MIGFKVTLGLNKPLNTWVNNTDLMALNDHLDLAFIEVLIGVFSCIRFKDEFNWQSKEARVIFNIKKYILLTNIGQLVNVFEWNQLV